MFQRNKVIRVPLQDPVAAALMESGILEQAPGSPDQTILGWIVPVRLSTFAASKVDLAMLGFPEGDPTPEQLGAFAKYRPSFVKVIREHDQLRTGDWF